MVNKKQSNFNNHNNASNLGKGGSYAGPSIKRILRKLLDDLELKLSRKSPQLGKAVAEYLRATNRVYELCMAETVSSDYPDVWKVFRRTFFKLRRMISLPFTLKLHVILGITFLLNLVSCVTFSFNLDHIPDYFKWYGRTFRHTTGEIIETVHSKLKTLEQKHQLRVKTSLGTIYHKERLRKSICLWNFKVLGPIQELETTPTGPEVIGAAVALLDHSYH